MVSRGKCSRQKAFEQEANPTKQDSHKQDKHAGKLLTAAVNVKYKDGQWLVISDSAEKASNTFTHKQEAIERAQEIARNKQTKLKIYKQDGTLQETKEYTEYFETLIFRCNSRNGYQGFCEGEMDK